MTARQPGGLPALPMLTLLLGSNIGSFDDDDALAFLRRVRAAGRAADWLLLGVDLVKPARDVVPACDDPLGVTGAFNTPAPPDDARDEGPWNKEQT